MNWRFWRRKPEETSTVKDAVKVRDDLHDELGEATGEVDRLKDRILAEAQKRLRRER